MQRVRTCGIPIAVIAGGGFTRTASSVVAHSVLNLYHLGLISGPSAGLYASVIANNTTVISKSQYPGGLRSLYTRLKGEETSCPRYRGCRSVLGSVSVALGQIQIVARKLQIWDLLSCSVSFYLPRFTVAHLYLFTEGWPGWVDLNRLVTVWIEESNNYLTKCCCKT